MLPVLFGLVLAGADANAFTDLSLRIVLEEFDIVDLDPTAARITGVPVYHWDLGPTAFLAQSLFAVERPGGYQEQLFIDPFERADLAGGSDSWQRNTTLFTPAAASGTVSLASRDGLASSAELRLGTDFPVGGAADTRYLGTASVQASLGGLFLDAYSQVTLRGRIETTLTGGAAAGNTAEAIAQWAFTMTPRDFSSNGILPIAGRSEAGTRQLLWGPGEQSSPGTDVVPFAWTLRNDSPDLIGEGRLALSMSLSAAEAMAPVPELGSAWLALGGLGVLGLLRRGRSAAGPTTAPPRPTSSA